MLNIYNYILIGMFFARFTYALHLFSPIIKNQKS